MIAVVNSNDTTCIVGTSNASDDESNCYNSDNNNNKCSVSSVSWWSAITATSSHGYACMRKMSRMFRHLLSRRTRGQETYDILADSDADPKNGDRHSDLVWLQLPEPRASSDNCRDTPGKGGASFNSFGSSTEGYGSLQVGPEAIAHTSTHPFGTQLTYQCDARNSRPQSQKSGLSCGNNTEYTEGDQGNGGITGRVAMRIRDLAVSYRTPDSAQANAARARSETENEGTSTPETHVSVLDGVCANLREGSVTMVRMKG